MAHVISQEEVRDWLEAVKDPEIPVLSLSELGVITDVIVDAATGKVKVEMTPTFAGCPAIEHMRNEVEQTLESHGVDTYEVRVSFDSQWNSNMISEAGRQKLKDFGLAPPPKHDMIVDLDILQHVQCPYCGSEQTDMKSPFGPTLCRSLHYCNNCKQAFEQFKPL